MKRSLAKLAAATAAVRVVVVVVVVVMAVAGDGHRRTLPLLCHQGITWRTSGSILLQVHCTFPYQSCRLVLSLAPGGPLGWDP